MRKVEKHCTRWNEVGRLVPYMFPPKPEEVISVFNKRQALAEAGDNLLLQARLLFLLSSFL